MALVRGLGADRVVHRDTADFTKHATITSTSSSTEAPRAPSDGAVCVQAPQPVPDDRAPVLPPPAHETLRGCSARRSSGGGTGHLARAAEVVQPAKDVCGTSGRGTQARSPGRLVRRPARATCARYFADVQQGDDVVHICVQSIERGGPLTCVPRRTGPWARCGHSAATMTEPRPNRDARPHGLLDACAGRPAPSAGAQGLDSGIARVRRGRLGRAMRAGRLEGGAAPRPVGPPLPCVPGARPRKSAQDQVGPHPRRWAEGHQCCGWAFARRASRQAAAPDAAHHARSPPRAAPRTSLRHAELCFKRTRCRPRLGSFLRINRTSGAGRAAHRGVSGWPSRRPRGSRSQLRAQKRRRPACTWRAVSPRCPRAVPAARSRC